MRTIKYTSAFKKDYKREKKGQHRNTLDAELQTVLEWVSRRTVLNAEKGDAKLSDLIAILGALNMLNNFNVLIPEVPLSPIELLKLQGKVRKRASGNNKKPKIQEKLTANPELDW